MTSRILRNSILVVAHPDDEVLWFSSLVKKVDHIMFCFLGELANPEFGALRKKVVLDYPLPNLSSLELTSLGARRPHSFVAPKFDQYGMKLVGNDDTWSAHTKKYQSNYRQLLRRLPALLRGYENVITHNPWGEYGHEEHVQVCQVLREIQNGLGYDLWSSTYCSTLTASFPAQMMCGTESITLATDERSAREITDLYVKHDCWTWDREWSWPAQETFVKHEPVATSSGSRRMHLIPINLIMMPTRQPKLSVQRRTLFARLKMRVGKIFKRN